MRFLLYIAPVLLFCACSGGSNRTKFKGMLTNDFMKGTWMVAQSDLSALESQPYAVRDSMDTRLILNLFRFDGKTKMMADNGDILPQQGTYQADEKSLKVSLDNNVMYYSLERGSDSSLILRIEKSDDPLYEDGKIVLKRMNTEKYKINDLSWKQAPTERLSGGEIKKKLQAMLTYYEHFFRAMMERDIEVLAHRKIMLPVKYFSNGIELRPFEERKGWDVYFGDSTHARTAYVILEKAYDKIFTFPTRKSPFETYAIIFSNLTKNIDAVD